MWVGYEGHDTKKYRATKGGLMGLKYHKGNE
jgi:hypothetical protein